MTRSGGRAAVLALLLVVASCASASDDDPTVQGTSPSSTTSSSRPSTTSPPPGEPLVVGPGDRPAQLIAPADVAGRAPLLVLLHGYGSNAAEQDAYLGVTQQAASRGLYVLLPNGTQARGRPFWDAGSACCNFTGTPVDDVSYLRDLIHEAGEVAPIDPKRIYVFGHSNGGFMAYRLACDAPRELTAIAVLAGSMATDAVCDPDEAVSVLHLHGTADDTIEYGGGSLVAAPFLAAEEVVAGWAERDGCEPEPATGEPLDLVPNLPGPETTVQTYEGCAAGIDVQLDTMTDASHVPALAPEAVGSEVLDWLLDHSR
jgi:polyhydroxybutyrate depolymerase